MHFLVAEDDPDHDHKAQNETKTETDEETEKGIAIENKKEGTCNRFDLRQMTLASSIIYSLCYC